VEVVTSALFVGCSFLDDSSISVETGGIVVVISQAAETEVPGGEEVGAAVEIAIQSPASYFASITISRTSLSGTTGTGA
jgi:hypothetical protein